MDNNVNKNQQNGTVQVNQNQQPQQEKKKWDWKGSVKTHAGRILDSTVGALAAAGLLLGIKAITSTVVSNASSGE